MAVTSAIQPHTTGTCCICICRASQLSLAAACCDVPNPSEHRRAWWCCAAPLQWAARSLLRGCCQSFLTSLEQPSATPAGRPGNMKWMASKLSVFWTPSRPIAHLMFLPLDSCYMRILPQAAAWSACCAIGLCCSQHLQVVVNKLQQACVQGAVDVACAYHVL